MIGSGWPSGLHVEQRQRAERPADEIEPWPRAASFSRLALSPPSATRTISACSGCGADPQRAQRKRRPFPGAAAGHPDQLQAAAAKVGDNAIGAGNGRNDAEPGQFGLLLAGKQPRLQAKRGNLLEECLPLLASRTAAVATV